MPAKKNAARRGLKAGCIEEPSPAPASREAYLAGNAASYEIGRAQILKKYWELANLDPEITKGTITGQLKALDSLCGKLGLAPATRESEKPASQGTSNRGIYRSAWMHPADKSQDGK